MFAKLQKRFSSFHREDKGLEALQVVMIVAIAAMVLIAVAAVGKGANNFMGRQVRSFFNNEAGLSWAGEGFPDDHPFTVHNPDGTTITTFPDGHQEMGRL